MRWLYILEVAKSFGSFHMSHQPQVLPVFLPLASVAIQPASTAQLSYTTTKRFDLKIYLKKTLYQLQPINCNICVSFVMTNLI
jgi:hypothetical protein